MCRAPWNNQLEKGVLDTIMQQSFSSFIPMLYDFSKYHQKHLQPAYRTFKKSTNIMENMKKNFVQIVFKFEF